MTKQGEAGMNKKMCIWHRPMKLGYIAWHDYADKRLNEDGDHQLMCKQCSHWFFPEEFGDPRVIPEEARTVKRIVR